MSLRHLRKLEQLQQEQTTEPEKPSKGAKASKKSGKKPQGSQKVIVLPERKAEKATKLKEESDQEPESEAREKENGAVAVTVAESKKALQKKEEKTESSGSRVMITEDGVVDCGDEDEDELENENGFENDEDEDKEEEEKPAAKIKTTNLFALLQGGGDEDEDENEDAEESEEEPEKETKSQPKGKSKENTNQERSAKSKKSKGKGKEGQSPANTTPKQKRNTKKDQDEDFDELISQFESQNVEESPVHLLQTEKWRFNYHNEMKRMFGASVVKNEMKRKTQREGYQYMPVVAHKKCTLVNPSAIWPKWTGGIKMEATKSENGATWYKFVYAKDYMVSEQHFQACRMSYDPNRLIHLIQSYPYQINGLYNLSEYFRLSGDMVQSAELLEMAIYAWECAFLPSFNPYGGNCRMDFSIPENELFLNCIFRHMQVLGRKGCARTTLEFCKFILSLDPERDPCKILLCIDYYSIRCREYSYLFRFYDEYGGWIEYLPNFAYTIPLALHLWQTTGESSSKDQPPAAIANKSAAQLITEAVLTFPWVIPEILQKGNTNQSIRGRDGITWKDLVSHNLFKSSPPELLKTLIDVFVERGHTMWKADSCQDFLKEAVKSSIKALDEKQAIAIECKEKAARFKSDSLLQTLYRRVSVADFSDNQATIPAEHLHGGAEPEMPRDDPRNLLDVNENPLRLFLTSLLPWMHPPGRGQMFNEDDDDDEDNDEDE